MAEFARNCEIDRILQICYTADFLNCAKFDILANVENLGHAEKTG